MAYLRYYSEQLSEHLFVVGQDPPLGKAPSVDCHVYLIVGPSSVLAVDAGSGKSWPFVRATAERYGFAEKPISHVLVTHGHADHAGGLTRFENQGALTTCSAYAAEHLDSPEDADVIFDADGSLSLGEFRPMAVLTPGHTPGSASYRVEVNGRLCLFTGDLVQIDGGLTWCGDQGFSREEVVQSLRKLAGMPAPDILLAGHGYVVGGMQLIEKGIAYGESGKWVVWTWTEGRPNMP